MGKNESPLTWKRVGIKALWVIGIVLVMFLMTWIELYTRASEKYTEADKLLVEAEQLTGQANLGKKEARLELAIETYAEVISMHYAPFSPWVRKTQDKLQELGALFEQQNNRRLAVKSYQELEQAYPPLPYQAFPTHRQQLREKIETLKTN